MSQDSVIIVKMIHACSLGDNLIFLPLGRLLKYCRLISVLVEGEMLNEATRSIKLF